MRQIKAIALPAVLVLTLLLSACSAAPTPDPAAVQATIDAAVTQAMQAAAVQQTSTALAQPTSTATTAPTLTATSTVTPEPSPTIVLPTATKTFVPAPPKPTATATPSFYSCQLSSQSPAAGAKINVGTDFDASWIVKNVGTKNWEVGYLDLRYDSGTKMQTVADIFDIPSSANSGSEITLIVDMKAPSTAGKYSASWTLLMDGAPMCTLPVSIEAVNP